MEGYCWEARDYPKSTMVDKIDHRCNMDEGRRQSMALNIKNSRVDKLVTEVVAITGESKTEAIYKALLERRRQLAFQVVPQRRTDKLRKFLEHEVWTAVPERLLGKRLTRKEEDDLLGYGANGV
jgi:antitoxin VapB